MTLYESSRPSRLSEIVGQAETVAQVRKCLEHFEGGSFWFHAPSGQGKSTIARCILNALNVAPMDTTIIGGADCTVDFVRETVYNFALSTWGESGWKAVLVDEAHDMTDRAISALKPLLEDIDAGRPKKRLFLFTSNKTAGLIDDAGALQSRCKYFSMQLDKNEAAAHLANVASREGLNGQPLDAYRVLLTECQGNMRAALQRIEAGEMLKCIPPPIMQASSCSQSDSASSISMRKPLPVSFVASRIVPSLPTASNLCERIAAIVPDTTIGKLASKIVQNADSGLQARIQAELKDGAKYRPGSPKYAAHKARLAALESERA